MRFLRSCGDEVFARAIVISTWSDCCLRMGPGYNRKLPASGSVDVARGSAVQQQRAFKEPTREFLRAARAAPLRRHGAGARSGRRGHGQGASRPQPLDGRALRGEANEVPRLAGPAQFFVGADDLVRLAAASATLSSAASSAPCKTTRPAKARSLSSPSLSQVGNRQMEMSRGVR